MLPLKILIVDTEETYRRSLARALRGRGHEVYDVATVKAALHIVCAPTMREVGFDAIATTMLLEDGTGSELAQVVLHYIHHEGKAPRIVFMSALPTPEREAEARKFGLTVWDKMEHEALVRAVEG